MIVCVLGSCEILSMHGNEEQKTLLKVHAAQKNNRKTLQDNTVKEFSLILKNGSPMGYQATFIGDVKSSEYVKFIKQAKKMGELLEKDESRRNETKLSIICCGAICCAGLCCILGF